MLCPAAILMCSHLCLCACLFDDGAWKCTALDQSPLVLLFRPLLCPVPWSIGSNSFAFYRYRQVAEEISVFAS